MRLSTEISNYFENTSKPQVLDECRFSIKSINVLTRLAATDSRVL